MPHEDDCVEFARGQLTPSPSRKPLNYLDGRYFTPNMSKQMNRILESGCFVGRSGIRNSWSTRRWRYRIAFLLTFVLSWQAVCAPAVYIKQAQIHDFWSGLWAMKSSSPQSGDTVAVFGPRRFGRASEPLTKFVEKFTLPADSVAPYSIKIDNGAPDGASRVPFARVRVN